MDLASPLGVHLHGGSGSSGRRENLSQKLSTYGYALSVKSVTAGCAEMGYGWDAAIVFPETLPVVSSDDLVKLGVKILLL